jgi:hypothetical protein
MKEVVLEEAWLAGSNQAIGKRGLQGWIRYGRTTRQRHSDIQKMENAKFLDCYI